MENTRFDPNAITISFASNPRYLKLVRSITLQAALCANFCEKLSKDITLAVDEAITNIIKHSYNGSIDKEIMIRIIFCADKIEIHIRDFGRKVDPETIKPRSLDEIKPGGLGVFFIKKIMDDVYYDISPDEGTILKLIKYNRNANITDNIGAL